MKLRPGTRFTDEGLVRIDTSNPPPGRIDRSRMGRRNPNDTEPRLEISKEDLEATVRLAREEGWPRIRRRRDATE